MGRTSCRLCGASPATWRRDIDGRFSLVECPRCGLVSTAPALTGAELLRYYPQRYYGDRNQRFRIPLERLIRIFRGRRVRAIERFVAGGRLLDVGCGRGLLPALARERGWEAHGVELSATAAEHAAEVLGIPVFVGDFMASRYPRDFFDAVVFWHVLEHLEAPRAALEKSGEILRPGGLLVVAVPNLESLQARLTGRHWFHLDVPRHLHHFRLGVLLRLLADSGFEVAAVSHFSCEQNPYGWIQSLLNRAGFRANLLYDALKRSGAREEPHPVRAHPGQFLLMLCALPVVVPLGLALFLFEAAARRGGTVEVYARKAKAMPGSDPAGVRGRG